MKIETIYFLERVNKGNFEHMELSATAKVDEGEDAVTAMVALKNLIHVALTNKVAEMKLPVEPKVETPVVVAEVKEEKPKQTRTRKPKEEAKIEDTKVEVVEEVKETPKKEKKSSYTPYGQENKAVLQAYLTKKYAEAWKNCKPRNEIIDFTGKLQGKDFLDDKGNIIPSFLELIHEFFGA
jgi:hypothetical protein